MLKKIFLLISCLLLLYLGISLFDGYLTTHPYYTKLLAESLHRKILIWGIVFSLLPASYIVYTKKKSRLGIWLTLYASLGLFGVMYVYLKWWVGWYLTLIFNTTILLGLAIYMLIWLTMVGEYTKQKLLWLTTRSIFDVLLSTGLWLAVFLLINHVLILLNLYNPIVTRAMFVSVWVLLRKQSKHIKHIWSIVVKTLDFSAYSSLYKVIIFCLLVVSLLYLFNGFYLADIAYSTAWDANHAYMFFPKMWALNNGYYWNEIGMATSPQLRYSFIAFWFSLFSWTGGIFGISVDNIAISLNFWSGIFVLIFGLWLIAELIQLVRESSSTNTSRSDSQRDVVLLCVGWTFLLLRLSSGMWAFLVFVDNKTDLWVLALIIIAIYSGLVAMRSIQSADAMTSGNKFKDVRKWTEEYVQELRKRWITKTQANYLALSWFFYAIAGLAKPTALFDVINFWLFAWWSWMWWLWVVWAFLLVLWLMSLIKFRGIQDYIAPVVGKYLWGIWFWAFALWVIHTYFQKSFRYFRYLLVRWWVFLLFYVLIKIVYRWPRAVAYPDWSGPAKFVERLLFSDNSDDSASGLNLSDQQPLYAQVGALSDPSQLCNLQSQWLDDASQLYDTIQAAPGSTYDEDVGRYIWFGRKWAGADIRKNIPPFENPRRWFWLQDGCYSLSFLNPEAKNAKILCENESVWRSFDDVQLLELQTQFSPWTQIYDALWSLLAAAQAGEDAGSNTEWLNAVEWYMQSNTLKVTTESWNKKIYAPYKYLNFLNITYNRSLQNLSSYYTDIWVPRLFLIIFSVVWLIYGLFARHRILSAISAVTIFGRVLRFFIWGGILWYGIGIVMWSIMSFVVFLAVLLDDSDDLTRRLSWMLLWGLAIFAGYQLLLNFVRLASQWWWWAFMRYKSNTWVVREYNDRLEQVSRIDRSFGAQDVFDLQFPHYNALIQTMNDSSSDEWALIAGTYARYFIDDQTNIRYDQFLTWLREQTSDGDVCNTYLRLKDNNKKYIVIDPNIGTVVQWAGNQSLFDRFFARVDTTKWVIVEDGVMTMLARMVESGYMRYYNSNNLWAKYAYMLPDTSFGSLGTDSRILERARLSTPRFFGETALSNIIQIAEQRVLDGSFVEDIADMVGKQVRSDVLRSIVSQPSLDPTQIAWLTQDERFVIVQYLNLRQSKQNTPDAFVTQLQSMIQKNITSWSQIIVLEVN